STVAGRVGAEPVELSRMSEALVDADLLVTCAGSATPILDADDVASLMVRRQERPLLVVDIAMPRNVEPGAGEVAGVTLLDMDDLRAFAATGLAERRREVGAVESIIDTELE